MLGPAAEQRKPVARGAGSAAALRGVRCRGSGLGEGCKGPAGGCQLAALWVVVMALGGSRKSGGPGWLGADRRVRWGFGDGLLR